MRFDRRNGISRITATCGGPPSSRDPPSICLTWSKQHTDHIVTMTTMVARQWDQRCPRPRSVPGQPGHGGGPRTIRVPARFAFCEKAMPSARSRTQRRRGSLRSRSSKRPTAIGPSGPMRGALRCQFETPAEASYQAAIAGPRHETQQRSWRVGAIETRNRDRAHVEPIDGVGLGPNRAVERHRISQHLSDGEHCLHRRNDLGRKALSTRLAGRWAAFSALSEADCSLEMKGPVDMDDPWTKCC